MKLIKHLITFLLSAVFLTACDFSSEPNASTSSPSLPLYISLLNDDDNRSAFNFELQLIDIEYIRDSRTDNYTVSHTVVSSTSGTVKPKNIFGVKGQQDLYAILTAVNSYELMDNDSYQLFHSHIASFILTLTQNGTTARYYGHPSDIDLKLPPGKLPYGLFFVMIPNSPALKGIPYLDMKAGKCGYGMSALKNFNTAMNSFELIMTASTINSITINQGTKTSASNIYWDTKNQRCAQGVYDDATQ